MDEVVAHRSGIFLRELIDALGDFVVPVHVRHDAGDDLLAILLAHEVVELLGGVVAIDERCLDVGVHGLCLCLGLEVQLELRSRGGSILGGHDGASGDDECVVGALLEREGNLHAGHVVRHARGGDLRAVEGDIGRGGNFDGNGVGELQLRDRLCVDLGTFGNALRGERDGDAGRRRGLGLWVVAATTRGEGCGKDATDEEAPPLTPPP